MLSGMGLVTDMASVVSTATTASITTINKKIKQARAVETVKNSSRFFNHGVCEILTILLFQFCVDFDAKIEKDPGSDIFTSQIALWGCRAINNLAKNPVLKMKFAEIGAKELISILSEKYKKSKSTSEWINIAKETLH
jgi:hypothetical protein